MNSQQQQPQQPQMATPISNLPLKTSPPKDQTEIEDPLIQNVLKEFEDDVRQQRDAQYQQPLEPQQYQQSAPQQFQQQHYQQPVLPQYPNTNQYPKMPKKLLDVKVLKSTAIIAIIVFLLQNYNIINILAQKLPEIITRHITGKEMMLNFLLIFGIFYALMYFELI